ncbi:MAG: carbamoyltransferase HypF [Pseudomonadota bacterium]
MMRVALHIQGAVQGVGFRPHVWRQARAHGLQGFVRNIATGVEVEVQGEGVQIAAFEHDLLARLPPLARVNSVERRPIEDSRDAGFEIRRSEVAASPSARIPVEAATCRACLAEVLDPSDRRHRHAFGNCTDCGPRYTILRALPYDRASTSMGGFALCADCAREYSDPDDRRFHAQPVACPACGPRLQWLSATLDPLDVEDPLEAAARALREGEIVALKGLGGFHLACRADDNEAVQRLRMRKGREARPLAVLVPDLEVARQIVTLDGSDAELLRDPSAPILVLPKRRPDPLAPAVAPQLGEHGILLAYTPLHHLLLHALRDLPLCALVLTSANLDGDPLVSDGDDLAARLGPLADKVLSHDRTIVQRLDDSLLRPTASGPLVLRRARGLTPWEFTLPLSSPPLLAVGAELKLALAVASGRRVVLSPHVGTLGSPASLTCFEQTLEALLRLSGLDPSIVVRDLHPDLLSSRWAERESGLEVLSVQHHRAHVAAVLVDNEVWEPCIGVAWDGFGLGDDGTAWGAEFFAGPPQALERVGRVATVPLPGGDLVARQPWRAALAHVAHLLGPARAAAVAADLDAVEDSQRDGLLALLTTAPAVTPTSSMGRLFDAVAALVCGCRHNSYEAQSAALLEAAAGGQVQGGYPLPLRRGALLELDTAPLFEAILDDTARGVPADQVSARFHGALVAGLVDMCQALGERHRLRTVALGGGSFANRILLDQALTRLQGVGFRVLRPRRLPPGDGGLCIGQLALAAAQIDAAAEPGG